MRPFCENIAALARAIDFDSRVKRPLAEATVPLQWVRVQGSLHGLFSKRHLTFERTEFLK